MGIIIGVFILGTLSYVKIFFHLAKTFRKSAAQMNGRNYVYEIYGDYFLLNISQNNTLVKSIRVDYTDIDAIKTTELFLTVAYDGQLYLFKKDTLPSDSVLYSLYRNRTNGKPVKPIKNKYRTISIILFVFSLLSILGALICAAISSAPSNDFTEHMWVFFLFTPIPVASVIFGFLLKSKGYKYKKNVVAGVIMTVLLCTYGSFTFIFKDIYTHTNAPVLRAEELLEIDIPDYSEIATQDWTKGTQNVSRGNIFSVSYVSFDHAQSEAFERQMADDEKWLCGVPNDLIGITSAFADINGSSYCIIYNIDTGEFNSLPENPGTYRFINLLYSARNSQLMIVEYEIECIKAPAGCAVAKKPRRI